MQQLEVALLKNHMLVEPSQEEYNLITEKETSMGQGQLIRKLFKNTVQNNNNETTLANLVIHQTPYNIVVWFCFSVVIAWFCFLDVRTYGHTNVCKDTKR